jgi:hypothetical protein
MSKVSLPIRVTPPPFAVPRWTVTFSPILLPLPISSRVRL